ncbi:MAG TPA: DUF2612 domain-containing protein [Clostridiaceae bacterium]|nr:DUF2612 domain-containing protein [Clostridiaceae bacterium]
MLDLYKYLIEKLTDNYSKSPKSNIGKLFKLAIDELTEIKDTLQKIEDWRDVDKAEGYGLDRIGFNARQFRGMAPDEIYRVLIKSRIARNRSDGSINTIIRVLSMALDTDPSELKIVEGYTDPIEPEPASIKVMELPIKRILDIGMTAEQFARMAAKTTAAGVGVKEIQMYGTFQLSIMPAELEVDPDTGLSDIDMRQGGELGMIYQPVDDIEFPLD